MSWTIFVYVIFVYVMYKWVKVQVSKYIIDTVYGKWVYTKHQTISVLKSLYNITFHLCCVPKYSLFIWFMLTFFNYIYYIYYIYNE